MSIYVHQKLYEQNFFQKIFKILPKNNFLVELENILAENESNLSAVPVEKINGLISKYKVNIDSDFAPQIRLLYTKALDAAVADNKITENESDGLRHLKEIFNIDELFVKNELLARTKLIYGDKAAAVAADGIETESEKQNLEQLKKDLLLPDDIAESLYGEKAGKILQNFVDKSIADERLSPEEEAQINNLAKSLNLTVSYDDETKVTLEKYKLFWVIENGTIPTIESDINLQKSESLYFKKEIGWYEMKTVTSRVDYAGLNTRIRICKGVSFNLGSIAPERVTEDVWKPVDSGTLYLTNKRLIFVGAKANKSIKLDKILAFEPYKNGVQIDKDTGKKTFFKFNRDVDLFSILLSRLMNEA